MLLDKSNNACLADFGLARHGPAQASGATHAATRHLAGTYGFICPEFARTGRYDAACDVYSFGVMVLQMLTAKPAMVDDKELVEVVEDAFKRERSALALADASARWPRDAFLEIARVAKKCIKPKRAQRPSLAAVIDRLERLEAAAEAAAAADRAEGKGEDLVLPTDRERKGHDRDGEREKPERKQRKPSGETERGGAPPAAPEPAPEPVRAMTLPPRLIRPPWALDDDEEDDLAAPLADKASLSPGPEARAMPFSESVRRAPLQA